MADPSHGHSRLIAGATTCLAALVSLWGSMVFDRGVQRADRRRDARVALDDVLLPLFAVRPDPRFPVRTTLLGLLDPKRATNLFWGRSREVARLSQWLSNPDAPSVYLVTGPAGSGKTRLALEWAAKADSGRPVGVVRPGRASELLTRAMTLGEGGLFIVDDADTCAELAPLVASLEAGPGQHAPGSDVRLVLVAREAADLRVHMVGPGGSGRRLADQAPHLRLEPIRSTGDWVSHRFDAVTREFAAAMGVPAPPAGAAKLPESLACSPSFSVPMLASFRMPMIGL